MLVNLPPMGWNSWNTFGEDINDELIRQSADQMVELGLNKAGYEYIVIDDCWSERQRDPETGRIVADHVKFPNGMKAVADYVHSKGLKFGMYSCAGVRTCADYPGSFDNEFLDAKTFAEWGVDYLKYDYCNFPKSANGPTAYRRMGNALRACGRDIVYSLCNWGSDDVWSWVRSCGGHLYRSTGDIFDTNASFASIAKSQLQKFCYSGNNCFNDMDMLTVGMFGKGNVGRTEGVCTMETYKTQFALWCLMGSPLMLGCDLRKMTPEIFELVTNKELLAFNQDPEARPAFIANQWLHGNGANQIPDHVVLAKLLADGDLALGFFNLSDRPGQFFLQFDDLGFPASTGFGLRLTDVFDNVMAGLFSEQMHVSIKPFHCKVFRAHPEPCKARIAGLGSDFG